MEIVNVKDAVRKINTWSTYSVIVHRFYSHTYLKVYGVHSVQSETAYGNYRVQHGGGITMDKQHLISLVQLLESSVEDAFSFETLPES